MLLKLIPLTYLWQKFHCAKRLITTFHCNHSKAKNMEIRGRKWGKFKFLKFNCFKSGKIQYNLHYNLVKVLFSQRSIFHIQNNIRKWKQKSVPSPHTTSTISTIQLFVKLIHHPHLQIVLKYPLWFYGVHRRWFTFSLSNPSSVITKSLSDSSE